MVNNPLRILYYWIVHIISGKDMKLIKIPNRELFPPDNVVGQWIVLFSMAFNDLTYAGRLYIEAYDRRAETPLSKNERLYLFRLSCSHLRETIKLLAKAEEKPEIIEFFSKLPDDATKRLERLHRFYQEFDDSFTCKVLKEIRDYCFHYSDELDGVIRFLQAAQDKESTIFAGTRYKDTRIGIGDEASAYFINDKLTAAGVAIPEAMLAVSKIMQDLLPFFHHVFLQYYNDYKSTKSDTGSKVDR